MFLFLLVLHSNATMATETKRLKLDTTYLVGLKSVSQRAIRAVLQGLPENLRKGCNADNVETDLQMLRQFFR